MSSNPPQNPPGTVRQWRWSYILHRWVSYLPGTKRQRIVRHAKASLHFHGRMRYTQGPARSQLFHRPKGDFLGASADCSQYAATLCHWVGVKDVTDTDWTGTLCRKGRKLALAEPGCFVFFGTAPFVHMAVMVDRRSAIGFGDQEAPNQSSLSGLVAYFTTNGHPGHEFRDLTV